MRSLRDALSEAGHRTPEDRLAAVLAEALGKFPGNFERAHRLAIDAVSADAGVLMLLFGRLLPDELRRRLQAEAARGRPQWQSDSHAVLGAPPNPSRCTMTGLAAVVSASSRALLDFDVLGKRLRDCTVAEVDAYRKRNRVTDRWLELLTRNLPPEAIVGQRYTEEDAVHLMREAKKDADE